MSLPNLNDCDPKVHEDHDQSATNPPESTEEDADQKRSELIRLSESDEIRQSVKCIRKASNKVIIKIYSEYEQKQADNANTFLADALITKFAELMSALDVVDSNGDLTEELRNDTLLQKNVKSAVSFLTPFIPFIGLISGGATLGKYAMKHRNTTVAGDTVNTANATN